MIKFKTLVWFVALFSVAALNAQSPGLPNASLMNRIGMVEIQRGDAWWPISIGEQLSPTDRVRTASNSAAVIAIGFGRVVTLNERSEIQLRPANGTARVQLDSGSIKVFSASDFQVVAKDATFDA